MPTYKVYARICCPTRHTVREVEADSKAFAHGQALDELTQEGGVKIRHERYCENQRRLTNGMAALGFRALLPQHLQSPIITSFLYPSDRRFDFGEFYSRLKSRRFVIYPGKVTSADTFRIANIGHVFPPDIDQLLAAIAEVSHEMQLQLDDA